MLYQNNFRYGEISRRNAGRFDTEFYNRGAFRFRNMVTDFTGSASRRPPIRKLIDTDAELLIEFSISETLAYTIGVSKDRIHIYRESLDGFTEVNNSLYPTVDGNNLVLTSEEISELRWAQYYQRMYFVHPDFRPFYMDFNTASSTITMQFMTVLLNQDAKEKYWFTPSVVRDENGDELPALAGRFLYQRVEDGVTVWYLDSDFTEKYEYSVTYPPIHGEASYITNFDEFKDDDLLTASDCYPSGISIIGDSMFLYSTPRHPNRIWKSRTLGSSQFIEGISADTMHDFINFQIVITESQTIVDTEDLPQTDLIGPDGKTYYVQENGHDAYWLPDKNPSTGEYLYQTRVYYKAKDVNSEEKIWYLDEDDPDGSVYDAGAEGGDRYPVRKPIKTYDLSDPDKLIKNIASIDYTATDSCGVWFELNSGRMDKIQCMISGCDYIFALTSSAEWRLPGNFSAVNNMRTVDGNKPYTSYGSFGIAFNLNSSVIFLQKSGILREFYLYQGYMANGDVTTFNHEILSSGVTGIAVKNTPDPRVFFVMSDGSVVILTYDKENGVQSFSTWDMEGRKIVSAARMAGDISDRMLFLVKSDTESWIGVLAEYEKEDFSDEGKVDYISDIVTPYAEVVDNMLMFSRYKKAQRVWIRPYKTGHVYAGNAGDPLTLSNKKMGSDDTFFVCTGSSRQQFSFEIRAYKNEPMDILCYGYEVM